MDSKENEKKMKIAIFRFGVIGDLVTGARYAYGEREPLIQAKILRQYHIPFSTKTTITRSTILSWIEAYRKAGNRLEGLFPKERKDSGKSRRLSEEMQNAIRIIRKEKPKWAVPALIKELRAQGKIGWSEPLSFSNVYRFLENEGLKTLNEAAEDRRTFEAEHPNDIWQCDVMHGPFVSIKGKKQKAYLIAIIDDHSRLITHAQFYLSEGLATLKDCLQAAIRIY
jgi:transposase